MNGVYTRPVTTHGYVKGKRNGQQWETVVVKDDVISIKQSIFHAGETKTGKTWARFDPYMTTFWSRKSGKLRVYNKSGRYFQDRTAMALESGQIPSTSPAAMAGLASWYPEMDFPDDSPIHRWEWMSKSDTERKMNLGEVIRTAAYPLSEGFTLQKGLTSSLSGTAQEMVLKNFGRSRYRKDLVKAVGLMPERLDRKRASDVLKVAIAAAPTVPVDWIIAGLKNTSKDKLNVYFGYNTLAEYDMMQVRKLFRALNQKSLRRLFLTDSLVDNISQLPDAVRSFQLFQQYDQKIDHINFTGWKDLHDQLAREARKLKDKPRAIVYEKNAKDLVGTWVLPPYQSVTITAPDTTHDVIDWGNSMGHCIGSYAKDAPHRSLLYGVEAGGQLVGNMELDPKTGDVRQLFGKHNRLLDEATVQVVRHAITKTWPNANVRNARWSYNDHRPPPANPFVGLLDDLDDAF